MISYHYYNEIQPAPGVRKIHFEAKRQPLDQHLYEKYHSEYSIHVVQYVLQDRPMLEMNILQSLKIVHGTVTIEMEHFTSAYYYT